MNPEVASVEPFDVVQGQPTIDESRILPPPRVLSEGEVVEFTEEELDLINEHFTGVTIDQAVSIKYFLYGDYKVPIEQEARIEKVNYFHRTTYRLRIDLKPYQYVSEDTQLAVALGKIKLFSQLEFVEDTSVEPSELW